MKSSKSNDIVKGQQIDKYGRFGQPDRKSYSPTNHNVQNRLMDYENLAKKAKEQLR